MRDLLEEVFISMQNNKRRIALTGFSIGWGIFILIVLLGAGNGLVNGTKASLGSSTDNVLTLEGGRTILQYQGMPKGRLIEFDDADITALKSQFGDYLVAVIPAVSTSQTIVHNTHRMMTTVKGFEPGYMIREQVHLISGRDITQHDLSRMAKVCVVSKRTAEVLFGGPGTANNFQQSIGQWVTMGGTSLMVIGVYEYDNNLISGQSVYAPFTTIRNIFCPEGCYSQLRIQLKNIHTVEENDAVQQRVVTMLAQRHHCAPADRGAITAKSIFEKAYQALTAINSIQYFIWIIGIATLLAGIVGVANIMLITVKERTRELGVRKAMGASRFTIISMVLLESVFITMIFGYIGMMLGVGVTQLMNMMTANAQSGFVNPTVDFQTLILANVVMIAAGLAAGYVPARRAVSIKLVKALMG